MQGTRTMAALCLLASAACATTDTSYETFRQPPMTARPFVRWWWNGGRVNATEVTRELDVLKAAGIGGVEINTIQMADGVPPESLTAFPALTWLSPEWNQVVKAAALGARARGMTADILVGSGWPFGGEFLAPADQIQRVRLTKTAFDGGVVIAYGPHGLERLLLNPLVDGRRQGPEEPVTARKLLFLRLVPVGQAGFPGNSANRFDQGVDVLPQVAADGSFHLEIPPGRHLLYAGFWEAGFAHVTLGAPGADGPVVDHFNATAVRAYLDRMSQTLGPALGGDLGTALRAAFVDSIELQGANWTADLPAEFARRRGYDLWPYLPFVLDRDQPKDDSAAADSVRRARYDFLKTTVELFQERFIRTYVDWCHAHGVQARMQAYGPEAHPLEASMLVDLPEGETWLQPEGDRVGFQVTDVNRYVTSAAHLVGKRLISFEAMTSTVPVFRETLADFKRALDASLLTGVNHPILHGFSYSPREAGFPGWIRFGSYVNEHNTWWPYFHRWADYAARLSALFRESTVVSQVAVLAPRADEWSHHGLLYFPFPQPAVPWYQYALADALAQVGASSDFISESILNRATFEGGRVHFGTRSYDALVLEAVDSLEPATAASMLRFAQAGGRIAFIERAPHRSPGLVGAGAADAQVVASIAAALAVKPNRVTVVPAPAPKGLLPFAQGLLERLAVVPDAQLTHAHETMSQLHLIAPDGRPIFFFVNRSQTETVTDLVHFATGDLTPWRWDPETGARSAYPFAGRKDTLALKLGPEESLLLVFEPAQKPGQTEPVATPTLTDEVPVDGPWDVDFQHMDPKLSFRKRMATLGDLSLAADDPRVATFAGTAVYQRSLLVADAVDLKRATLDLGTVFGISEVALNGKPLGTRWYGRHVYDLRGTLHSGANTLTIKVTVLTANYAKSLRDVNPVAYRWARWYPPIATGLVGPVTRGQPVH